MKRVLVLILITSFAKTEECEKMYIDIIKSNKQIRIHRRFENKEFSNISNSIKVNNKKIFAIKINGVIHKNKKWYEYKWYKINIENNEKIKTKYAIEGSRLIIYIPEKEKIENFIIKACKKHFIRKTEKIKSIL